MAALSRPIPQTLRPSTRKLATLVGRPGQSYGEHSMYAQCRWSLAVCTSLLSRVSVDPRQAKLQVGVSYARVGRRFDLPKQKPV